LDFAGENSKGEQVSTYKMVLITCDTCGEPLVLQGGNIYLCPNCGTFVRLVGYGLAFEEATIEDAQLAIAADIAEMGIEEVLA